MNLTEIIQSFVEHNYVTRNKTLVEVKNKTNKRDAIYGSPWTHQQLTAHTVEQEPGGSSTSGALSAKFVRPGFPSRREGALFYWRPRKPSIPLKSKPNIEATETVKGARDNLVNLCIHNSEETTFTLGCHVEGSGYLLRTLRVRTQQERVESAGNRYGTKQVFWGCYKAFLLFSLCFNRYKYCFSCWRLVHANFVVTVSIVSSAMVSSALVFPTTSPIKPHFCSAPKHGFSLTFTYIFDQFPSFFCTMAAFIRARVTHIVMPGQGQ